MKLTSILCNIKLHKLGSFYSVYVVLHRWEHMINCHRECIPTPLYKSFPRKSAVYHEGCGASAVATRKVKDQKKGKQRRAGGKRKSSSRKRKELFARFTPRDYSKSLLSVVIAMCFERFWALYLLFTLISIPFLISVRLGNYFAGNYSKCAQLCER